MHISTSDLFFPPHHHEALGDAPAVRLAVGGTILDLRGTRETFPTPLHGPKWWHSGLLVVGDFLNHPTAKRHPPLAYPRPSNVPPGTTSTGEVA